MTGYISVEIPTKRYIKTWLIRNFGEKPVMCGDHVVGLMLFAMMERHQDERASEFAVHVYDSRVKLMIPVRLFKRRGHNLNKTNIKDFNIFVQQLIKADMRFYLDFYTDNHYKLKDAIEMVQAKMGFTEDDMPVDTIQKDYFRYREKKNLPMLKGKKVCPKCPFDFLVIQQFERSVIGKKEVRKKRIEKLELNKAKKILQMQLFG